MENCLSSSSLPEVLCERGRGRGRGRGREWSDLPNELLECIADRLGLIELLGFRGVCKSWNAATSSASAAQSDHESQPWFLTYGGGENSTLFADSGRKYRLSLSEMEGATCLASNQGWLLLHRQTSIFFFSPFSRALIHLPSLISHLHRAAAQFSSLPTSHDCAVCVIARAGEHQWKIYQIRRGADAWTESELTAGPATGKIEYVGYCNRTFSLIDERLTMVSASDDGARRGWWKIDFEKSRNSKDKKCTRMLLSRESVVDRMEQRLGLKDINEEFKSISVCGTLLPLVRENKIFLIPYHESDDDADEESSDPESRRRRIGVWLHPRFHQVDPSQTNW